MNHRKFLVLVLTLCLVFALCGCNADNQQTPDALGTNSSQPSQGSQQGQTDPNQGGSGSSGSVDFGLQPAPDPNFDSPASGGNSGKIYTIQGDYAYEMDPNTLQIIGPPLDPITHEPVDNPVEGGGNPSTPNNPQDNQPAASDPPASEPPASESPAPTTDTKLPNTGMFLEDD